MVAHHNSHEIHISRVYDAPLALVWDAWTDPAQVAKWWGPRGFTLTTHSHDLRTGGTWHYTMHGPDGVNYENKTKYLEVQTHSKMIYDHGGNDDRPPLFRVTVLFSEVDGKTKMEMSMALATPEAAAEIRKHIKKVGGESTWDRLAEYLAKESSEKELFVINRSFDAPLELMFDMWTDPNHMTKWATPTGFTMEFIRVDIRPGGGGFYVMSGNGGIKMYGKTSYLEIRRPDRIIYTQQFADQHGNTTRHPMSSTWPETMLTTVTLYAEGPDRTRVTLTWEPYGTITAAEMEIFIKARAGMSQGWGGSFDRLDEYLATDLPAA